MEKQYITAYAEKQGDKLVFVASDETKDRYGDVIPIDNWDLRNYKKAPRLLVDHEHKVEKIVGKAHNIKKDKDKKRLTFEPVFHGLTELSRQTEEMVREGFLDTVSVGFIPHEAETEKEKADAKKGTRFSGKNELIEISFVTVPANPNAHQIKSLLQKEEKTETKDMIEDFMSERFTGEVIVKQTEVQELIFSKKEFSRDEALKWSQDHSFKTKNVDETETSYKVVQFDKDECTEGSERTISLQKGLRANVCKVNKGIDVDDVVETNLKSEKARGLNTDTHTPKLKGKSEKGRSFTPEQKRLVVMRDGLKEAVRIINRTLYKSK